MSKDFYLVANSDGLVKLPRDIRKKMISENGSKLRCRMENGCLRVLPPLTLQQKRIEKAKEILAAVPRDISFIVNRPVITCYTRRAYGLEGEVHAGVSVCNSKDEWSTTIGKAIAYLRMNGERIPMIFCRED